MSYRLYHILLIIAVIAMLAAIQFPSICGPVELENDSVSTQKIHITEKNIDLAFGHMYHKKGN